MECKCLRCGHTWRSMIERPRVCPRCKSYVWDKPFKRKRRAGDDGK
jgi:predicted Zn-ribbon and HTH transcriptional regulator